MNGRVAQRLCGAERITQFIRQVRDRFGPVEVSEHPEAAAIPLEIPGGETLYASCPGMSPEQRQWLEISLSQLLAYEYEVCDVTHELSAVYEELTLLYRLSESLSGTLDLETIQKEAVSEIAESLEVRRVAFLMLDAGRQNLVLSAGLGVNPADTGTARFARGQGLAWKVLDQGASIIANNVSSFPDYLPGTTPETNVLLVPLITKRGAIGVLSVGDKDDGTEFSSKDEKLLSTIAHQMGAVWENAVLYREARELFLNTVEALSAAIDAKDTYTHGHSQRVTTFAVAIAGKMDLPREEIENIRIAALLHDIGKLGISEAILRKPDRLTGDEFAEIKKHPGIGAEIMGRVRNLFRFIPGMVDHHERFDGSGYPQGRKAGDISLAGRIIAVADTLDAMTSDRPYHQNKRGKPDTEALGEIKRCSGSHFDPMVVEAFLLAYQDGLIRTQSGDRERQEQAGERSV